VHIDVHTLAIVLSLTNLSQVIALFIHYRVDETHAGPGYWTLCAAAIALGFAFTYYLRDTSRVAAVAIVRNNLLFLAGASLLYLGVVRFQGRPEPRRMIAALFAVVSMAILYFTFVIPNVPVRRVIISIALLLVAFLASLTLFRHKPPKAATSTYFLGKGIFSSSSRQIATYISALVSTTLWTLGFILMVNQRLNAERQQTIEELYGALEQIRTPRGILPICAHCKKIRDDQGFWQQCLRPYRGRIQPRHLPGMHALPAANLR
jgi:hypothetical protein